MIKESINILNKFLEKNGVELILDNYKMKQGIYILVDNYKDIKVYNIEYNKTKDEYFNEYNQKDIKLFSKLDFYSNLLSIDKPVDIKKKIHSNNGYSFFVKRKTLLDQKVLSKSINLYYSTLRLNELKHKSLKIEMEKFEREFGEVNIEDIDKAEVWIKNNISDLNEIIDRSIAKEFFEKKIYEKDTKELSSLNKKILSEYKQNTSLTESEIIEKVPFDDRYIKIFFTTDIKKVQIENDRYLINKIALKNDYNTIVDNEVYGVSGFNITLNSSKKPYIINKTRPNQILGIESIQNLKRINEFKLLLDGYSSSGKNYIYLGDFTEGKDLIKAFKKNEIDEPFKGLFLNIFKSKQVDILDSESVNYTPYIDITITNILNGESVTFERKRELLEYINKTMYCKFMINSMYIENNDISDSYIKTIIKVNKELFKRYFIYGKELELSDFRKNIDEYIKYSILYSQYTNIVNGISLKYSIIKKEESGMDISTNEIIEKINEDKLDLSSKEMLFLSGQLLKYYASNVNNRNNRKMILKVKTVRDLIDLLNKNIVNLKKTSKRSDIIHNYLIQNLKKCDEVNTDMIILGNINELIIFEKCNEEDFI